MKIRTLDESWRDERGGQVSYLLLRGTDDGSDRVTVTWVECAPGSEQPEHRHVGAQQVYVIVRGAGRVTIEDAKRDVVEGTSVLIEPGERHSIRNIGQAELIYVSITAPPLRIPADRWTAPPVRLAPRRD
jgi:mannose-6-phosphate isomerase-like protein (cupin superfamily)